MEFNGEFNGINSAIIELTCPCVRLPKTCLLGYFSLICRLILVGDGAKRFASLRHKHLGLTSDHDISWPLIKVHNYYFQQVINASIDVNIFERFEVDGEEKYLPEVQELIRPERNTLTVSYQDVESYNAQLSTIIQEEYYR